MCWADCPALQAVTCAAGCAISSAECKNAVVGLIKSVLEFLFNVVKRAVTPDTSDLVNTARGILQGAVTPGMCTSPQGVLPNLTPADAARIAAAINAVTNDIQQSVDTGLATFLAGQYAPDVTAQVLDVATSQLAVASILPEEAEGLAPACLNALARAVLQKSSSKLTMTTDVAEAIDLADLIQLVRAFAQYGKCPLAALPQSCDEAGDVCGTGTCSSTKRWECASCGNSSLVGPACTSKPMAGMAQDERVVQASLTNRLQPANRTRNGKSSTATIVVAVVGAVALVGAAVAMMRRKQQAVVNVNDPSTSLLH